MRFSLGLTIAAAVVAQACSEGRRDQPATETTTPSVHIQSPTGDQMLDAPNVTITLAANGIDIVPAGTNQPNSGHHHLFINRDLTPVGVPIPTEDGIVHMGLAQTEHVFEALPPGEHVVIAVLGDYQHVRLGTVATDTVRFTVRGAS